MKRLNIDGSLEVVNELISEHTQLATSLSQSITLSKSRDYRTNAAIELQNTESTLKGLEATKNALIQRGAALV